MPWRRDFAEAYWIDPDYKGLAGYPDDPGDQQRADQPLEGPPKPRLHDVQEAVLIMRDRIGFQYERRVGLGDLISQRDAAKLLGVDLMTVTRWVKRKKLPSRKRKGFKVLRVRDVVLAARKQGIGLPLRFLLVVEDADHQERHWYPTGGSR